MAMAVPENLIRYECLYMAKLAEQAQRYEETVNFMEKLVISSTELTVEERNLLSTASKKVIDSLRAAWKAVSLPTEQNEQGLKNDDHVALLVTDYKSKIESKLSHLCTRIQILLDKHLIPSAASESESKVFYLKMKGDYYRYLTEFKVGAERKEAAENTMLAYEAAAEIAVAELDPTHPTRLGLALNFSVFCYEIEGASEKACSMAREAFEEAMAKLNSLGRKSDKDTALVIMQLLRDNLNLWASSED